MVPRARSERIDCDYRLALALGQQARERPATAADALPRITALLAQVVAAAPELDEAGGQRVLALVLLRAPGWPVGPGDPEQGLAQAREAVRLSPAYPPNLLALAEALAATAAGHRTKRSQYLRPGRTAGARAARRRRSRCGRVDRPGGARRGRSALKI